MKLLAEVDLNFKYNLSQNKRKLTYNKTKRAQTRTIELDTKWL